MWLRATKFGLHVFLETLAYNNIENWWYQVRQLLKNETENSYYKVITKCGRSASGITKCDKFITKCIMYYKVWQAVVTKRVRYYKVPQLLQSEM